MVREKFIEKRRAHQGVSHQQSYHDLEHHFYNREKQSVFQCVPKAFVLKRADKVIKSIEMNVAEVDVHVHKADYNRSAERNKSKNKKEH